VVESGRAAVSVRNLDMVVAGGPTHAFSMTKPATRAEAVTQDGRPSEHDQGLHEWLIRLEHADHSVRADAFDTRQESVRGLPGLAARAATRQLGTHGFASAGPPTSLYVTHQRPPRGR